MHYYKQKHGFAYFILCQNLKGKISKLGKYRNDTKLDT